MRFDCILSSLILSLVTLVVEATPPACLLKCVNDYARWCPNRHADIGCFYKNSELFIGCLTTKCHSTDFEAARDHFLGVCLELLPNPPPPPPQLIKPPSSEPPSPTTPPPPVKHKPPKYGHRKPKTKSLIGDHDDAATQTETRLVETPSPTEGAIKDESGEVPIEIEYDFMDSNSEKKFKESSINYNDVEDNKSVEGKRDIDQGVLTKATSNNKQIPNPYQPYVKTSKNKESQVEENNQDNLNEEISNIAIEIENEANAQTLPTFNRKKPYGRHLPNFSKKKLVNRIPTDQALGNSKVRSHLKQT